MTSKPKKEKKEEKKIKTKVPAKAKSGARKTAHQKSAHIKQVKKAPAAARKPRKDKPAPAKIKKEAPRIKEAAAREVKAVAQEAAQRTAAPQAVRPSAAKKAVSPEAKPVKPIPAEEAKAAPAAQAPVVEAAPEKELKEIELRLPISLKDLAVKLQQKPSQLIKMLMQKKVMVGINQVLEDRLAQELCAEFGCRIKKAPGEEEVALQAHFKEDQPQELHSRSPVVTFMGHVDHGKTSLLDAIRKTKVVDSEHGGITQHIGAYRVKLAHGEISFLDTPGHEAFTAMRARGAGVTDIVVLVVAADDGVMPQTQEAIDHARAAGVSVIVAINKIDKPQVNIDRVKKQLSQLGFLAEDWGGKTITVGVSAKTGEGIDSLLEMILLEAQMLELKANPHKAARGVVIEAKMSKGRGPVATLLVQNGTLKLNDYIIAGKFYGKIKAMFNDRGQAAAEAAPSYSVEVLGLSGVPLAGEQFFVMEDEKKAKEFAHRRQEEEKMQQVKAVKRVSLEDLHARIKEGSLKELKIIIKADVQGSLEAVKDTLAKIDSSEVKISVIHDGVGAINSSDVVLAMASNALIIGFNVNADERAKEMASREGVEIKTYNIIYELANEIKAALEGMLEPKLKRNFLGKVEVRKIFKLSRSGMVAGCFVSKGKVTRSCSISVVRNGEVIFEGGISSLKRFKDDVREVGEGYECGITLSGFSALQEGDALEAYEIEKIARKL